MEAPSANLERSLSELRLVSPRDLDRCRSLVARRVKGLPVFDSVWIEALIESGKLTTFQGRMLDKNRGEELKAGTHWILTEQQLASRFHTLYAAQEIETKQRFLITRVPLPIPLREEAHRRLQLDCKDRTAMGVLKETLPIEAIQSDTGVDVVFPFSTGVTLQELLVRRGRFPEKVVRSIAIEVAQQLLIAGNLAHGDLQAANVRLLQNGQIRLLNWGVLFAVYPEVSIHSDILLESLDAIGPERFHSGLPATKSSDMYALGCLLWQLLAGRTVFPMADRLTRIVAHQQRSIPDIREVAPDVSETFAALIRQMTFREPHRRLQNYRTILEELSTKPSEATHQIKAFRNSFESAAPRRPGKRRHSTTNGKMTVAAVCLLTLVAFGLMWNRTSLGLPGLTSVAATTQAVDQHPTEESVNAISAKYRTLPDVRADGLLELTDGTPYLAASREFPGNLRVAASSGRTATILIVDAPLSLSAQTIEIENVRIIDQRQVRSTETVLLNSQELSVKHCRFDASAAETANTNQTWLNWRGLDQSDPRSGRLLCTDTLIQGAGKFLQADLPVTTLGFNNVLKFGVGALIQLDAGPRAGLNVPCVLQRCTLRDCGSLVRFTNPNITKTGRLSIQSQSSVYSPLPDVSMVEFQNLSKQTAWESHLEIDSHSLIIPQQIALVSIKQTDQSSQELETMNLKVDGLLSGIFEFSPAGDLLIESLPVRTSSNTLGADTRRFITDDE